jgi:hypothetical protein
MTPERIARLFYEYFNERRLDDAAQLVDPRASFHYVPTRQRLVGRAGYKALVAAWLQAFEDARLEIQTVVPNGSIVQVEFIGRGTHTGDLVLGDAVSIPATGRTADLPFRDRLDIRDGLVVSSELDFDLAEMKRRLLG